MKDNKLQKGCPDILEGLSKKKQVIYQTLTNSKRPSPNIYLAAVSMVFVLALITYLLSVSGISNNALTGHLFGSGSQNTGIVNSFLNSLFRPLVALIRYCQPAFYLPGDQLAISGYELLFCFGAVLFILWSAFWSADTAEILEENRLVAFILGTVLPYIYPVILYRKARKEIREIEKFIREKTSERNDKAIEQLKKQSEASALSFSNLPEPPFTLLLTEGNSLEVKSVNEVKGEYIDVEILTNANEIKKARIPVQKIKSIVK